MEKDNGEVWKVGAWPAVARDTLFDMPTQADG